MTLAKIALNTALTILVGALSAVAWYMPSANTSERLNNINGESENAVPADSLLKCLDGVVQIACNSENAAGSGFVIGRSAEDKLFVLTSYRVIENDMGAGRPLTSAVGILRNNSPKPTRIPLRVLCFDSDRDLALLETEAISPAVKEIVINRDTALPKNNESVFAVGFPMGRLSVLETKLSRSECSMFGREATFGRLSDYSHSGQRGSPVFSLDGEVVATWRGITKKNRGFCVMHSEMVAFLDEHAYSALCH